MENSDQNVPAENAENTPEQQQQQPNADAQTQSPLPTYESVNADAQVVTPDVISERLKAKSDKPAAPRDSKAEKSSTPLGAIRDANRRKRRERGERSEPKIVEPAKPHTGAVLPNRREGLGDDLESEFSALMEGQSLEEMMKVSDSVVGAEQLETGDKVSCRIEKISKDSVFVNIGACELGCVPLKQFPEDMVLEIGQTFDAVVNKFNSDDGYYEVSLPLAAAEVGDWLSLTKGAIVEATVTAVNKGGLEMQVGKLRGFMPNGQIAPFFVENAEQFVGERWKCVVTEINPERRNLVVSRRAIMEKERAELREKTLAELAVGQTRQGSIRKIIDVGAFVDLGGVDGFIHISELGWGRVQHVSDVVKVGDVVTVTVLKIDEAKKRISLSLRDAAKDPWNTLQDEFAVGDVVRGVVTRILDFGAFVQLPTGPEGLVHISEIAYQRVDNVSDVLNVGDAVDVKILAIDGQKRKISLSIKQTQEDPRVKARAEAQAKADADAAAAEAEEKKKDEAALAATQERIRKLQPKGPLKGGLSRNDGEDLFGLHL